MPRLCYRCPLSVLRHRRFSLLPQHRGIKQLCTNDLFIAQDTIDTTIYTSLGATDLKLECPLRAIASVPGTPGTNLGWFYTPLGGTQTILTDNDATVDNTKYDIDSDPPTGRYDLIIKTVEQTDVGGTYDCLVTTSYTIQLLLIGKFY